MRIPARIIEADAKEPSLTQALITKDGAVMAISYGNSEDAESQGHTGTQLSIAAYGPHAANVAGLTDQTDLVLYPARCHGVEVIARFDGAMASK